MIPLIANNNPTLPDINENNPELAGKLRNLRTNMNGFYKLLDSSIYHEVSKRYFTESEPYMQLGKMRRDLIPHYIYSKEVKPEITASEKKNIINTIKVVQQIFTDVKLHSDRLPSDVRDSIHHAQTTFLWMLEKTKILNVSTAQLLLHQSKDIADRLDPIANPFLPPLG